MSVSCGVSVLVELMNDLIERGLDLSSEILVILDGGKGIRKALRNVMGDKALVQRCRVHKLRNILDHLPKESCTWFKRMYEKAWEKETEEKSKEAMESLAKTLEQDHPGAAGSIREGLDELFTVKRFNISEQLSRSLSSTNIIENLLGRTRTVTRKVKRWRNGEMIVRWMGTALLEAEKGFRKIRGYKDLPISNSRT